MKTFRFLLTLLFLLVNALSLVAQVASGWQKDTLWSLQDRSTAAYESYDYKNAIKLTSELIEKGTEYNDDYSVFLGYDLFASIYIETDDSVKARVYAEKALEIAEVSKSDSLMAWGYLNLGIIHSENNKYYEKGIRFFNKSISINEKINEPAQVHRICINLAWTYLDHDQEEEAYAALLKARSIAEEVEVDSVDVLFGRMLLGRYYHQTKKRDLAKKELELTAAIADKDSITDLAFEVYDRLAKVYFETEDYKNAFESLKKYNHYEQKIYTTKHLKETQKARAEFELEQAQNDLDIALKDKEYSDTLIAKSKDLTTILVVASVILLIALLGFFLLFKTRKSYVNSLKTKNKELVKAKEKAEKLSKVKTQFFSTVSHELRTPLYGVIGISTILQEDGKLKDYQQDLESLKFSADYLLALINDVLLMNKMDADAIVLGQTPYALDVLVNGIIRSFEFSLQQNKNKLHVHIDEQVPNYLVGDPVQLSQILMNLIGNAIKFNENGNVWLEISHLKVTEQGGHRTRFVIKDDGIGIPKDKQKSIFDEFSQVENKNHSYKGTGLGLPIVKKLLKLYNSKIHLKSELGEGSEFSFSLDLVKNDKQIEQLVLEDTSVLDIEKIVLNPQNKIHVLVVDDNKINQKITQRILEKHHFKSSVADDGQQAVKKVRSNEYDLVLMDVNMPKVNGLEATETIRKFNTNIPIIALTAVAMDEMRIKILNSGMDDIILKPYDISHFLTTILKNLSKAGKGFTKVI